MSQQGVRSTTDSGPRLAASVPLTFRTVDQLRWDLGDRLAGDAALLGTWTHEGSRRAISVYDATDRSVLLQIRSPVGRERYYSAAKVDLDPIAQLTDAENWQQTAPPEAEL